MEGLVKTLIGKLSFMAATAFVALHLVIEVFCAVFGMRCPL